MYDSNFLPIKYKLILVRVILDYDLRVLINENFFSNVLKVEMQLFQSIIIPSGNDVYCDKLKKIVRVKNVKNSFKFKYLLHLRGKLSMTV